MIDKVFEGCVIALMWAASRLGMSYNEINVWVFCVIWPAFTLFLMYGVYIQRKELRRLVGVIDDQNFDI